MMVVDAAKTYKFKHMKKYLAEFLGTFALIFCGTGAIIINQETNGVIGHAGVAATFGLVVMCMIYTFVKSTSCVIRR